MMTRIPDLRIDPFPWYAQMLDVRPVPYSAEMGAYLVFRADEVRKVMSDYQSFSSAIFDGLSSDMPFEHFLTGIDPPKHTQLRALAAHAFTPKAVQELEPRIREIATKYLDTMLQREDNDFVRDFAVPFPIEVIAEMLGLPEEDRPRFKKWSDIFVEIAERMVKGQTEALPEHVAAFREMLSYFTEQLHHRREHPKSDLMTRLALAEVEGRHLSDTEASHFCLLLMVAGNETTTHLLTNAVRTFAEHPDQWQRLFTEQNLIPQAVEEVMRFRPSIQLMFRLVSREVELGGALMKPGERVGAFLAAANRDPAKFDNPDVFDISRPSGPHLTFGHGIHFCLGAPLARMEMAIALKAMLEKIDRFVIPPGAVLEPLTTFNLIGLKSLPIQMVLRQ